MKKQTAIAVCGLLLLTMASWKVISWQEFHSSEGRFVVLAPDEMQRKVNSVKTAVGEIDYYTFVYKETSLEADNLAYIVGYCDYPEGTAHSDSTKFLSDFFDATIETAVKSVKGDLVYANQISLKKYPGRYWRIDYNGGEAVIKTKSFLVKNRYYSVQVISLRKKSINPSTDKFMDSFRFFEDM